jgi:glutamine synthetase
MARHGVFTEGELRSRYEIMLENYSKAILIEAETMAEMAQREILPAVEAFTAATAEGAAKKKALSPALACAYETKLVERLSRLTDCVADKTAALERALIAVKETEESVNEAFTIRDIVLPRMAELRAVCDEAETATAKEFWPFPTYGELLFSVR